MKKALLVVAMLLVFSAASMAQEAVEEGPQYTVFTKLGRGIGNIFLGPIELPVTIFNVGADTDVFIGVGAGGVAGCAAWAERWGAAVVDIVTFPFPPYDRALVTYELGKSPAAAAAIATFPGVDEF